MTYLELCEQSLALAETHQGKLSGDDFPPASGYERNAVRFVADAWVYIQRLHDNWGWMRQYFEAVTEPGRDRYSWKDLLTPSGWPAIPSFRSWANITADWYITQDPDGAGGRLRNIGYEQSRMRQRSVPTPSRPNAFAIAPNLDLVLHPAPRGAYHFGGECQSAVQVFEKADDEPRGLPGEYHPIIKWRAVMLLHGSDEAAASYQFAATEYLPMLLSLERLFLPKITVAEALA